MQIQGEEGKKASLESMYVTPDLSGVGNEILGAAAQPLGAKIEILGVAAQPLAWRRALAHKEGNSGLALTYIHRKMCARSIPKTHVYLLYLLNYFAIYTKSMIEFIMNLYVFILRKVFCFTCITFAK